MMRVQYAITPKGVKALEDNAAAKRRYCPVCSSPPGFPCVVAGNGKPRSYMHASRYLATGHHE
jgi:hypothetical protein